MNRQPGRTLLRRFEIFRPTAPRIISQRLGEAQQVRPHRIQMHIVADGAQVAVAAVVHDEGFVTSAEQVAEKFVPPIKPRGVSAQEPSYARDEIAVGRLDDQMKMIGHETIRLHLPVGFGASLGERGEKAFVIGVIVEDWLAAITAIHDVIDRAGIFNARRAGHDQTLPNSRTCVNTPD